MEENCVMIDTVELEVVTEELQQFTYSLDELETDAAEPTEESGQTDSTIPPIRVYPPIGKKRGINVHYGQPNNGDYTADTIPSVIDMAVKMNMNYFRCDFSTDENGLASASTAEPFIKAAKDAGLGILGVLYLKNKEVEPVNGETYTDAELTAVYDANFTAANGFAMAHPHIKYYQMDNELDLRSCLINYEANCYGTSTADTSFNWLCYPGYISAFKGFIDGARAVTPDAKLGLNYSWIHSGLIVKLITSLQADGYTVDWVGIDEYNSEENGKDPQGNPMFGKHVQLARTNFSALVPEIFVTEYGFKISKANGKTQDEYFASVIDCYRNEADGDFLYEAISELKSRAKSNADEQNLGVTEATIDLYRSRGAK